MSGIGGCPIIGHPIISDIPNATAPHTGPKSIPQIIIGINDRVIRKSGRLTIGVKRSSTNASAIRTAI
jgi:hypothetical protein